MATDKIRNFEMDYHRNGTGGLGSYIASFEAKLAGESQWTHHIAFLWGVNEGGEGPTEAMVLLAKDMAEMATGSFPKYVNAFRSTDYFLPLLRPAIKEWTSKRYGSNGGVA